MVAVTGYELAAVILSCAVGFALVVVAIGWAAGYQERNKRTL